MKPSGSIRRGGRLHGNRSIPRIAPEPSMPEARIAVGRGQGARRLSVASVNASQASYVPQPEASTRFCALRPRTYCAVGSVEKPSPTSDRCHALIPPSKPRPDDRGMAHPCIMQWDGIQVRTPSGLAAPRLRNRPAHPTSDTATARIGGPSILLRQTGADRITSPRNVIAATLGGLGGGRTRYRRYGAKRRQAHRLSALPLGRIMDGMRTW